MERPRLSLPQSVAEALRLAPVRPAIAAGVRAGLATVVPLGVGLALGLTDFVWIGLAGFLTSIVDKGGAYRTRASAMAAVLVGGLTLAPLAGLGGSGVLLPLVLTLAAATLLSYMRVYGGNAGAVGSVLLVLFLVSLAQPASGVEGALTRGLWCALGAAWAMLVALFLWPLRPYRPARARIAIAVRGIAVYAAEAALGDATRAGTMRAHRAKIRQALEDARATLTASRRGRRGESSRGQRLLVLLESSDRVFALTVSLAEHIDTARARGHEAAVASQALAALANVLVAVAAAIERERPSPPIEVPAALAARAGHTRNLGDELVARLASLSREVADVATSVETERPVAAVPSPNAPLSPRVLGPLRDHLTLRSAIARHALRAGVTTAAAAALAHGLGLERGQWVTIACAITLQPQLPATYLRAVQRVLGTMAGALIAASLTGIIEEPAPMLVAVFLFAVIGVSAQPVSYALYATFLTPTFVLLAESATHDPSLALTRVVNTLIGGALALGGARWLWPISERDLFPGASRAALAALHAQVRVVAEGRPQSERDVARREVGLALLNAEASLQRWLAEVRRSAADLEAPLAAVAYMRQLAATALALGESGLAPDPERARAPFFAGVLATLQDLSDAVASARAPRPLVELAPHALEGEPDSRERLERMAESLAVLHAAITRWLATLK